MRTSVLGPRGLPSHIVFSRGIGRQLITEKYPPGLRRSTPAFLTKFAIAVAKSFATQSFEPLQKRR